MQVIFCSCKHTCSKVSGRKKRGCPCLDEGLRCAKECTCGTKKSSCRNIDSTTTTASVNVNAGRDAFERHHTAVEEAKQQITVCTNYASLSCVETFTICIYLEYFFINFNDLFWKFAQNIT